MNGGNEWTLTVETYEGGEVIKIVVDGEECWLCSDGMVDCVPPYCGGLFGVAERVAGIQMTFNTVLQDVSFERVSAESIGNSGGKGPPD